MFAVDWCLAPLVLVTMVVEVTVSWEIVQLSVVLGLSSVVIVNKYYLLTFSRNKVSSIGEAPRYPCNLL